MRALRPIKSGLILVTILIQMVSPVSVLAEGETVTATDAAVSTTETTAPAAESNTTEPTTSIETTGPTEPTGADGDTYVWNPETGLWENDYYTWDPVTKQTSPKNQRDYSYNPETGMWDTTEWYYSPEQGRYVENTVSASQDPSALSISDTGPGSTNTIDTDAPLSGSIDTTGPNSSNEILLDSDNTGFFDMFFDASISHTLNSTATSGDANILHNTLGGNALSGDAATIANILNMLQSSWGLGSGEIMNFIANIDGDVYGDIYIDPGQIGASQSQFSDLTVTSAVNGQINNDITLDATSGNATVADNTTGGNATSGAAYALANVINLINSVISAGQSFVGTININGSLEGDILLPTWLREQLLASASGSSGSTNWAGSIDTTGPDSTNTINTDTSSSLDANFDTNSVINNSINTTATSGDATVSGNTTGGNATSGETSTNITLLNLTGRQIIGSNSLLVFVNVLGEWIGLIMDAPEGTTSAVLGGGISNALPAQNTTIDATTNSEINNNVNVSATSGDATVSGNTTGGNATSGDAKASANLLNIVNSQLSLSDWFGILFINVLGSWRGSFGIDTTYGNQSGGTAGGQTEAQAGRGTATAFGSAGGQTFRFVPRNAANSADTSDDTAQVLAQQGDDNNSNQTSSSASASGSGSETKTGSRSNESLWIVGTASIISVLLLGGDRLILLLRKP